MANAKYNISKLFQSAFGINSPIYITETFKKEKPLNISFKGVETLPDYVYSDWSDKPLTSWMGTPIVFPVKFLNNQGMRRYKADGSVESIQLSDFQLPPATMFSFSKAKYITRTNILGNSGTVKEIYGFDDWVISAKGLCLDEPNKSAKSQLDELLSYFELACSVGVSGALFLSANIKAVCIESLSYDIVQGSNGSVISFEMQLIGDEDITLVIG